jgi:hypothetical protein
MPGRRLKSPAVCDYDTRQRSELSSLETLSDCNLRGRPICTAMRNIGEHTFERQVAQDREFKHMIPKGRIASRKSQLLQLSPDFSRF